VPPSLHLLIQPLVLLHGKARSAACDGRAGIGRKRTLIFGTVHVLWWRKQALKDSEGPPSFRLASLCGGRASLHNSGPLSPSGLQFLTVRKANSSGPMAKSSRRKRRPLTSNTSRHGVSSETPRMDRASWTVMARVLARHKLMLTAAWATPDFAASAGSGKPDRAALVLYLAQLNASKLSSHP